jgi:LPS-assembly lipoprotein
MSGARVAEASRGRAGWWHGMQVAAAILAATTLTGCGFHPLYAPGGSALPGLRDVFVDVIPNRNGQLLREALQRRLEGTGNDESKQYELSVTLVFAGESIGIQSDNSSSRTRYRGSATWTLRKPGFLGAKIATNTVHSLDGSNVIDEQFFYSDLSSEAIQRRMAENLADAIVQELAVYFRAHPEQA